MPILDKQAYSTAESFWQASKIPGKVAFSGNAVRKATQLIFCNYYCLTHKKKKNYYCLQIDLSPLIKSLITFFLFVVISIETIFLVQYHLNGLLQI